MTADGAELSGIVYLPWEHIPDITSAVEACVAEGDRSEAAALSKSIPSLCHYSTVRLCKPRGSNAEISDIGVYTSIVADDVEENGTNAARQWEVRRMEVRQCPISTCSAFGINAVAQGHGTTNTNL